jgi:RNA polymerase sigma-70 factor (ECF subfamily)
MPLRHIWNRLRAARAVWKNMPVTRQRHPAGIARQGPPAVALARLRYAEHRDILIDPLETESRIQADGFAVRAWVLVPKGDVPEDQFEAVSTGLLKLARLSQDDRHIFFLATSYELRVEEIAVLLGIGPRKVRRSIFAAIAALDTRET